MQNLSNPITLTPTYECLNIVLCEYKDYITARDIAMISGIPETTISMFRKRSRNIGVNLLDQIRIALKEICPDAYQRFCALCYTNELNLPTMVDVASLDVQIQVFMVRLRSPTSVIAQKNLFTRLDISNN